jgi:hypothetical protein
MTWKQICLGQPACRSIPRRAGRIAVLANNVSKRIHSKPQRPARRANQFKRLLIALYFVKFLSPAPKKHRKFLSGAVAKQRSICIIYL